MMVSVHSSYVPLETIADRLQYHGCDRVRSVRRLFAKHRMPVIKRGRGAYATTEQTFAALIEAMTCSPSESAANISTSAVRSVSAKKCESSKSILAEQIAATLQTPIAQNSKQKSATNSFTVVEEG